MKSYGFNELNGDWSLGFRTPSCLIKMTPAASESETQIQTMASRLAETGLTHARMDGHTDNYGEDSYNEALSLKRANAVADAWAKGANIPRSNLTTRG
jgi:outer membrane protein OmpA-like peptidoglycan-associated protein